MKNEERKIELIRKIIELAQVCSTDGIISGDKQAFFVGESIKVVLIAASNESHSRLLQKYVLGFLNEVDVLVGEKTLGQYFCSKGESLAN
jgi:hypothetical protein